MSDWQPGELNKAIRFVRSARIIGAALSRLNEPGPNRSRSRPDLDLDHHSEQPRTTIQPV